MKELNWNNTDKDNGRIYLANAKKTYRTNMQVALYWIDQAISYFEGEKDSLCDLAQCYYIKASLTYADNQEYSRYYFTKSIKTHIEGSKRDLYRTHAFYKFVGVTMESIESILNRIMLKHPSDFNDPMDCPIAASPQNGIPDIDLFNGLRIGCFGVVENNEDQYYTNASKWSYYGDFHKGICIEYDFSKLDFSNSFALMDKVKYQKEYTAERGIVGSGLLTKSCDYAHENEWRIIWFDESLTTHRTVFIDIQPFMITKIYLGYKCPEKIKMHILEFKSVNSHIQVYDVHPSNDNFYQLCTTELTANKYSHGLHGKIFER
ncbi:MAG: DUF2971 domain-containing protein [Marinifilaceae bacterium]|nr:DUF2971 domain-containing protein [Marinifilaceae bacterium]